MGQGAERMFNFAHSADQTEVLSSCLNNVVVALFPLEVQGRLVTSRMCVCVCECVCFRGV